MHHLVYNDGCLGFLPGPGITTSPSTPTTTTSNQPGKFQQVVDLIRGGLDTYRQQRGLDPYYRQPAPPSTQTPAGSPPGYDPRSPSGSGFGVSFDNQGLHLGETITLSPVMLLLIGAGIFLYLREPPRRGGR